MKSYNQYSNTGNVDVVPQEDKQSHIEGYTVKCEPLS